jgi:hypothetical protein
VLTLCKEPDQGENLEDQKEQLPVLPLKRLDERHPGVSEGIALSYEEAAGVCLDRHHTSAVNFQIDSGEASTDVMVEWTKPTGSILRAWANEIDTTEAGAYCCCLAAVEVAYGLVAIHRAETKSGADYYVATAQSDPSDLETCLRLEISGLDRGDRGRVSQRIHQKLEQAAAGSSNLPALAGVVGFRERLILFQPLEST